MYFNEEKIMAIKISYEWCIEELNEYEPNSFDIVNPEHSDIKELDWLLDRMIEESLFHFGIKKWYYNTERDIADWDHIYLCKDGKFYDQWNYSIEFKLPKYIMKEVQPYISKIINHKNFRE